MIKRTRDADGWYRDERPNASWLTYILMFVLVFVLAAAAALVLAFAGAMHATTSFDPNLAPEHGTGVLIMFSVSAGVIADVLFLGYLLWYWWKRKHGGE
jgi:hypothetical protein